MLEDVLPVKHKSTVAVASPYLTMSLQGVCQESQRYFHDRNFQPRAATARAGEQRLDWESRSIALTSGSPSYMCRNLNVQEGLMGELAANLRQHPFPCLPICFPKIPPDGTAEAKYSRKKCATLSRHVFVLTRGVLVSQQAWQHRSGQHPSLRWPRLMSILARILLQHEHIGDAYRCAKSIYDNRLGLEADGDDVRHAQEIIYEVGAMQGAPLTAFLNSLSLRILG